MAPAKPRTSADVTPLPRNAANTAPAMAGARSGFASSRRSCAAWLSVRSRRASRCSNVWRVLCIASGLEEITHQEGTVGSEHALRMKLHALDRQRPVTHAHDLALDRTRGDLEHRRHARRLGNQ